MYPNYTWPVHMLLCLKTHHCNLLKMKGCLFLKTECEFTIDSVTIRGPRKNIRALDTLAKRWNSPWHIQKKKYICIEKKNEWRVLTWNTDQKKKVTDYKRNSSQMLPGADKNLWLSMLMLIDVSLQFLSPLSQALSLCVPMSVPVLLFL